MTASFIYIIYIVAAIISFFIFYYVIKAAVREGIIEARKDKQVYSDGRQPKPEKIANFEQQKLQQQYDKGEITFEVYQSDWERLNK